MALIADSIKLDCDEDGWHLIVETDDGDRLNFHCHGAAWDFARSDGLAALREWAAEGAAVRELLESETRGGPVTPLRPV